MSLGPYLVSDPWDSQQGQHPKSPLHWPLQDPPISLGSHPFAILGELSPPALHWAPLPGFILVLCSLQLWAPLFIRLYPESHPSLLLEDELIHPEV